MGNKLFVFLVVLLSILIIASAVGLILSINRYNTARFPNGKPSVLEDIVKKNDEEEEEPTEVKVKESEYLLPSDKELIEEADLFNMDRTTLNKAYNEIFARHGHDFDSKDLKDYFNAQTWYRPITGKKVGVGDLSEIENKNLEIIKARIDKLKADEGV